MCIIVSKEKGIDIPSKKILETCFKRNPCKSWIYD